MSWLRFFAPPMAEDGAYLWSGNWFIDHTLVSRFDVAKSCTKDYRNNEMIFHSLKNPTFFRRRRDVEPSSPTPPPSLAAASSGNRHLPLSMICMSGSKINLVFILWIAIEVQRRLCHVQTMWVCVSSSVFRVQTDRKLCLTLIFWLIFGLDEYCEHTVNLV